jgi:LPXTG-motif cell wall-anchored protein
MRKGTIAGIGLSIAIGLAFWSTATLFEAAGKRSLLPVWMAAWGAQALFLALSAYLFFRRKR